MRTISACLGFLLPVLWLGGPSLGCSRGLFAEEGMDESQLTKQRGALVKELRKDIRDPGVLAVLEKVPRHEFVPTRMVPHAYENRPLPIGEEQTISQPFIVAYMTQALKLTRTDKVLEIGTGSGYQAAVLAELAREVYSIEIVELLSTRAHFILGKLGYKNIVFFGPAYAFGRDQWQGAKDAFEKRKIKVEYFESPVGTSDYTSYLLKIKERKPDIVMLAHWGVDAINVLKQTYEVGLKKDSKVWFNWMTNAFGSGVPPEALEGVYSLMGWYYDMKGFQDAAIVKASDEFTKKFQKEYKYPPDPYSAMAYEGVKEAVRGIELAKSLDGKAIAKAIMANPTFDSIKGKGTWRADHQPLFKYGAYVTIGKGAKERKNAKWDLVKIIGAYTGEDYLPSLKTLGY